MGIVAAVAALALCAKALIDSWSTVSTAIATADPRWLALALLASAGAMFGLAVLWKRTLATFDAVHPIREVSSWYFVGELGKYIPGGIWPVVGRGELAARGGVSRGLAYTSTLLSLALMCVGAALACGLLAPFLTADGGRVGPEMALLALVPIGVVCAHPSISARLLSVLDRFTKGRVRIAAPPFGTMLSLILGAVPTWLLVGGASVAVTHALGYEQLPARIAFAAIAAWIVGFLAVPVPAGAGVREILFVAVSGLEPGPAVAVAAIARLLLMVVDAGGGILGLLWLRAARGLRTPTPPEGGSLG
ncbi:lysylphosphatidylglycerol synthase domain-containing protein [Occultella gossypii]|uniref:Flippase-like domain-containing protein n=1 Tax=Occultella gossypii TaxID=2800820 RepID=A0ABS7S7T2_9MICO|nr:lysylphosphatidylglycerol synthase domain-containing protein [Occultella gossypii]MBZ2196414.1 flippase-like domain-containing protein [Occultella gossypii]